MTEPKATTYKYERVELEPGETRAPTILLAKTDLAVLAVQVIKANSGPKNRLHLHPSVDGFWTVLHGRALIYTTNDELVADLGPMEGVVIPRNFPNRIESVGDEDLEIMKVEATDRPVLPEEMNDLPYMHKDRVDL